MNKVCLNGSLLKDPELKIFGKNTSLCTFYIRNEVPAGKGKKKGFYKCSAWGSKGRIIAFHAEEGSEITVTGRLFQREYRDKIGNRKTGITIIVEDFRLGRKEVSDDAEMLKEVS